MNLMQRSADWLGDRLKAAAGKTVRLVQSVHDIPSIVGVVTMQEHEVLDGEGFLTKVLSYDWTFKAADLVSDGEAVTLGLGAVVTETIGDVENRYEAMPLGKRPAAEPLDTSGTLVVLHTRKVQ